MNKLFIVGILILCSAYKFKPTSKFCIDKQPKVNVDTTLLGIWKLAEDGNKKDYFLVQEYKDVFKDTLPHPRREPEYAGRHQLYFVTRFDNNGTNPHFQSWPAFLSDIKGNIFINIGDNDDGSLFTRILSRKKDTLTIAIVADKMLHELNSCDEVQQRFEKQYTKSSFYNDTLHLYKVSKFHSGLDASKDFANQH